jgi:peptide/nickel transport system substrate-binding protein
MPGQVRAGGLILAMAGVLALAACSSSSTTPTTTSTSSVKSGGSLTFALDEDIAGFNSSQAADNEFVLAEIMDQVWPQVFVIQPDLTVALDTDYVTSAKVTNQNPQTVVYQINPKAT